ncbi:uncharacterized protein LOC131880358, partial [Tigriopus californicus]|uniref:uncharacterized protein LOC131880358 n=1 Tax=Tigriopus californicus TaxID=6832 RepID=UPI0027DA0609
MTYCASNILPVFTSVLYLTGTGGLTLASGSSSSLQLRQERTCSGNDALTILNTIPSCQPRDTIVELPQIKDPDLYQVLPEVIRLSQCTGSCHRGNQYHTCVPTQTRTLERKVMVQRLNSSGHVYSTCAMVNLEEHLACGCGCGISPKNCRSNQYFNSNLCRCDCQDRLEHANCILNDAGQGLKMWDPQNCRCRCAQSFRECSTGYIYDQLNTCRCIPELRPANTVPLVALLVALIGTSTCLLVVFINYRKTKRVLVQFHLDKNRSQQEKDTTATTTATINTTTIGGGGGHFRLSQTGGGGGGGGYHHPKVVNINTKDNASLGHPIQDNITTTT